jgi:hypothetical protein
MKRKQLLKLLKAKGVLVENGGNHYKLNYKGNPSVLSRGTDDISPARIKDIKSQLKLED